MTKLIEYDVTDVETSGGGGSEEPKPAVYPAVIRICRQRDTKANGDPANDIEVALDLGGDYRWLYTYIGLGDSSDWKLAEFTRALALKEKGKFDPEKMVGKMVRVKVNPDTYEGETRNRAGRLMKALPDDTLPEPSSSNGKAAASDEEPDEEGPQASGADDEFEPTREDDENSYDDWDPADLEAEVEDRGLTVAGGRGSKKDKWLKALRADDEETLAEAEGPQAAGDEEPEDDYDTWEVPELEAEFKDRELELPKKPRGKNAPERYNAALIEALRKDDTDNPFDPEAE